MPGKKGVRTSRFCRHKGAAPYLDRPSASFRHSHSSRADTGVAGLCERIERGRGGKLLEAPRSEYLLALEQSQPTFVCVGIARLH
jgi:hypothetical protein